MTIYFVRLENDGPIKIGYTSGDAKARLVQLQTGQPGKLKLLGTIEGDRGAEAGLHSHFESFRLNGEWFSPDPDLLVTIQYLIDNKAPWYSCRDKSVLYEAKIKFLENYIKLLEAKLKNPIEFEGPKWFQKRISQETYKRQEAERKVVLLEQRLFETRKAAS